MLSTYRSARDSRRQMRCTQRRRRYPERKKEAVSLLDVRTARHDRTANRGSECVRPQLLRVSCVVAMAHNLLVQASTAREEDASCSRLDAGSVFREGFCMRDCQTSFEHDGIERLR